MNPIDVMILNHANKIKVRTFPNNPQMFDVVFSDLPSPEALDPLLSLINTGRFDWSTRTKLKLKTLLISELFHFEIEAINLIPVSDAIAALAQMWRDAGYAVTIDGQPEQAQDEPQESIAKR